MKIAMIGHKRIPGREGGIEVVVEELTTRMVSKGHEVIAYNRKKKGNKKINSYNGVKIITVPTIEKKNTDAIVYSFLATIHALFGKYDVIHYHALGPSIMCFIPHLFKKRVIVTVHGLNYKTPKWRGLGEHIIRFAEKVVVKCADEIIVLSKEQQKYFANKYHRKTQFISNGTTLYEKIAPLNIKREWDLNENGYILFLSRVVPGKGLEHLLEAYRGIEVDLPLVIAGESTYVDEFYENIKRMACADSRVRLIGFVEGQVLQELYSNAKIFVFPSEAEGMPMCLLEALSYDIPCLVSDIPENVEVGKQYVRTFKVADVDDLRKKLNDCLSNIDVLCTNKSSRDYVRENYEWSKVVERTLRCYQGELWH